MNKNKTSPLVILGLDTGDFDCIRRWAQEGYLPTIASIMERGCWAKTTGPETVCEYGMGLTLFSGISRKDHGYYYFRQLKPETYKLQKVAPIHVKAPPFWSHLREGNKKVLIVDVPDIAPVRGLAGLQLSNWAMHHSFSPPAAEPAELLEEVRRVFGPRMIIPVKPKSTLQEDRHVYRCLLKRIEKKGELCRHLLSRDSFDLTVAFFSETDPASHYFWKYRCEAQNLENSGNKGELSNAIRNIYQAIDREMGLLLKQLPEETNVVVCSLYGIQDEYPTSTLIESFLRQLGYQASPEKINAAKSSFLERIRKLIPETWRFALSRHLPATVQERLLTDTLEQGTDWSKTIAFAIPSLFTSFVRVNLQGREPQGIVKPGEEYEKVLEQLEKDLKLLVDPQTGKPAVKRIARTTQLFHCDPPVSLPDLFVEWEPGPRFLDRVIHPKTVLVQKKPQYCPINQEKLSGFFAACGPSIPNHGDIGGVSLLDLAPTFLALMDEVNLESLSGKAIQTVVSSDPQQIKA